MTYTPTMAAPLGCDLAVGKWTLTAGVAAVVNGVYAIDESVVDATTGLFYKTKAVATADLLDGIFVVADAAVASGANGLFTVCAVRKVLTVGTTDIAIGDPLVAVNASAALVKATVAAANSNMAVAKALEANATDTVSTPILVMFKGIGGFSDNAA